MTEDGSGPPLRLDEAIRHLASYYDVAASDPALVEATVRLCLEVSGARPRTGEIRAELTDRAFVLWMRGQECFDLVERAGVSGHAMLSAYDFDLGSHADFHDAYRAYERASDDLTREVDRVLARQSPNGRAYADPMYSRFREARERLYTRAPFTIEGGEGTERRPEFVAAFDELREVVRKAVRGIVTHRGAMTEIKALRRTTNRPAARSFLEAAATVLGRAADVSDSKAAFAASGILGFLANYPAPREAFELIRYRNELPPGPQR